MARKLKPTDAEALWRSPRARQLGASAAHAARRARMHLLVVVPALVALAFVFANRVELFGQDAEVPVRVATAIAILVLGFRLARDLGRSMEPILYRRMDRATAGTVSFMIRLIFLAAAILTALRIAGLKPETLAVGGAITAVVVGLAAQQTFGNVLAGMVLISARPFRVGDRVRLQAGGVAGQLEGVVTSVGLLYTIFAQGEDSMMVPNSVVLSAAVVPLREPAGVDLRARLRPDVLPSEVQDLLRTHVKTAIRGEASISLEEIDADEVVLRITATPEHESDGPRLADEILAAIAPIAREGDTAERLLARGDAGRFGDG
jgi:small-conductance mechanosensitive channel